MYKLNKRVMWEKINCFFKQNQCVLLFHYNNRSVDVIREVLSHLKDTQPTEQRVDYAHDTSQDTRLYKSAGNCIHDRLPFSTHRRYDLSNTEKADQGKDKATSTTNTTEGRLTPDLAKTVQQVAFAGSQIDNSAPIKKADTQNKNMKTLSHHKLGVSCMWISNKIAKNVWIREVDTKNKVATHLFTPSSSDINSLFQGPTLAVGCVDVHTLAGLSKATNHVLNSTYHQKRSLPTVNTRRVTSTWKSPLILLGAIYKDKVITPDQVDRLVEIVSKKEDINSNLLTAMKNSPLQKLCASCMPFNFSYLTENQRRLVTVLRALSRRGLES